EPAERRKNSDEEDRRDRGRFQGESRRRRSSTTIARQQFVHREDPAGGSTKSCTMSPLSWLIRCTSLHPGGGTRAGARFRHCASAVIARPAWGLSSQRLPLGVTCRLA